MPQIAAHMVGGIHAAAGGQAPLALDEINGYRFDRVKPRLLREAADILVISSVQLIMRAPELAQDLAKDNIAAAVRHCSTTKPLDDPEMGKAVRFKRRRVVVDENKSAIGGMGDALACTLQRHGVQPACWIPRNADAYRGMTDVVCPPDDRCWAIQLRK